MQRSAHPLHAHVGVGTGAEQSADDSDVPSSRGGMKRAYAEVTVRPIRVRPSAEKFGDDGVAALLGSPIQECAAAVTPVGIDAAAQCSAHRMRIASDAGPDYGFAGAQLANLLSVSRSRGVFSAAVCKSVKNRLPRFGRAHQEG